MRKVAFFSAFSATLGAVAALFFGNKENRVKIAKATKELGDKAQEFGHKVNTEAPKMYHQATGRIAEFTGKASEVGKEIAGNIGDRLHKGINKGQDIGDDLHEKIDETEDKINSK